MWKEYLKLSRVIVLGKVLALLLFCRLATFQLCLDIVKSTPFIARMPFVFVVLYSDASMSAGSAV